jgi:riboflavin-specific deaminase-like protein
VDDLTAAVPLRPGVGTMTPALAWELVLALRENLRTEGAMTQPTGLRLDENGQLVVGADDAWLSADPAADRSWRWPASGRRRAEEAAVQILDLYMPLCLGKRADLMVAAHLAQSLDGRVATANGVSQFISDRPDLVHTHRMRALFDAVIVGACTVELDDPQLTTRHVDGPNPVRVVLDPRGRLEPKRRVFCDGQAPTVLVRSQGLPTFESEQVEVVELPTEDGVVPLPALRDALAARGLRRLFIEGGGVTVSGFLNAGGLDRLHVTVAPMIIGSGRPAFTLPEIGDLEEALRLDCTHHFLGPDILFDCPLPCSM